MDQMCARKLKTRLQATSQALKTALIPGDDFSRGI